MKTVYQLTLNEAQFLFLSTSALVTRNLLRKDLREVILLLENSPKLSTEDQLDLVQQFTALHKAGIDPFLLKDNE